MIMDATTEALAREEVIALHRFFMAWFVDGGDTAIDFTLCERAFAPDFRMVGPDGEVYERKGVLERLRAARGATKPPFRIDILEPRPVWSAEEAVLLEYVERQYREGGSTRRRSTGLFTRSQSAPRGVHWRHLQETWIAADEDEGPGQVERGGTGR